MTTHFEVARTITDEEQLTSVFNALLKVPEFKATVEAIEAAIVKADWVFISIEQGEDPRYCLKIEHPCTKIGLRQIGMVYLDKGFTIFTTAENIMYVCINNVLF